MIKLEFKIININEIPNNGGLVVDIWPDDKLVSVIITRKNQIVKAFHNICTHANWRLENIDGNLLFDDDGNLICAGHCAIFDASNGRFLGGPGKGKPLKQYSLVFEGETVIVR